MALDKLKIYNKAIAVRKEFGESDSSPIDVFAAVQNISHLSLVLYPMGDNISGMCVKTGKDTVIAINSSMSIGRQNFSIAHELYHFYFDDNQKSAICRKTIGKGNEIEQSADQFASYFLMPTVSGFVASEDDSSTFKTIIEMEQYYKVSNLAMIYRILDEGLLTPMQAEKYKRNVTKTAAANGYDTALYKPSRPEKSHKTYGYYIKQTQDLLSNEIISDGKYEQLLMEAFRADLVYGSETEEEELDD